MWIQETEDVLRTAPPGRPPRTHRAAGEVTMTHAVALFDDVDLWSVVQESLKRGDGLEEEIAFSETRYAHENRTPLISFVDVDAPGGRREIRGFLRNGNFYLTRPPTGLVANVVEYARQITLGRPLTTANGELHYYPHATELDGIEPTVCASRVPARRLPGSRIFETPKKGKIVLHRLSKTTSITVDVTLYGIIPAVSELLSFASSKALGLLVLIPARVSDQLVVQGDGKKFYDRATPHLQGSNPLIYKLIPPRSLFSFDGKPTQTKLVSTVARLAFDPGFVKADQVADFLAAPPSSEWNVFGNRRFKPLTMSKYLQLAPQKKTARSRFGHLLPVALP